MSEYENLDNVISFEDLKNARVNEKEESPPSVKTDGVVLYELALDTGVTAFCSTDSSGVYVRFPMNIILHESHSSHE